MFFGDYNNKFLPPILSESPCPSDIEAIQKMNSYSAINNKHLHDIKLARMYYMVAIFSNQQ